MQLFYYYSPYRFFLLSLILGFALGLYFDIYRIIRRIGIKGKKGIFLEDLLFTLTSFVMIFVFTYCTNEGVYRAYEFLALCCGFLIEHLTVGKITIIIAEKIIELLNKFLKFLFKNTIIRLYILLDKFYKKIKILLEEKIKVQYEDYLLVLFRQSSLPNRKENVDEEYTSNKNSVKS
jgi:spore cortex biosynthesis protein YabQ